MHDILCTQGVIHLMTPPSSSLDKAFSQGNVKWRPEALQQITAKTETCLKHLLKYPIQLKYLLVLIYIEMFFTFYPLCCVNNWNCLKVKGGKDRRESSRWIHSHIKIKHIRISGRPINRADIRQFELIGIGTAQTTLYCFGEWDHWQQCWLSLV